MKKNFKNLNPALQFINQPTPQEHEEQETQQEQTAPETHITHEAPLAHSTQGKKGKKLQRINMAFSEANLEYLQLIGRIEGVSMTEYVNQLLQADSAARAATIEQAKTVLKGAK